MSASAVNVLACQGLSLSLPVEDYAGRAEAQSHYSSAYMPFSSFNDHLAAIGAEASSQPDGYWKQIVQAANLELKGADLLEKNDKKHRMGDLLEACLKIYDQKKGAAGKKTFYEWLDAIPEWERTVMIRDLLAEFSARSATEYANRDRINLKPSMVKAFLYGVRYLDRAGRKQYRLTFSGGVAKLNDAPFDTRNMRTVFSGPGSAIWIQSPKDHFYAGNHATGQFHHSSFLSGGAVKCGGEMQASQGVITRISAKSGHYQPSRIHFANAIRMLGQMGVNLTTLTVVVWADPLRSASIISAAAFLQNPSGWETWGSGPIPKTA